MRRPSIFWLIGTLVGMTAGVGVFTFHYARGASYFGHEAAACANCHVMREQFDGWIRSSHRSVAACNDCHAPHGLLQKFAVKGWNGLRHSIAFTLGDFHEPIAITPLNRRVTEDACRHCHEEVVSAMVAAGRGHGDVTEGLSCIRCHGSVGHPAAPAITRNQEASPHVR